MNFQQLCLICHATILHAAHEFLALRFAMRANFYSSHKFRKPKLLFFLCLSRMFAIWIDLQLRSWFIILSKGVPHRHPLAMHKCHWMFDTTHTQDVRITSQPWEHNQGMDQKKHGLTKFAWLTFSPFMVCVEMNLRFPRVHPDRLIRLLELGLAEAKVMISKCMCGSRQTYGEVDSNKRKISTRSGSSWSSVKG